MVTLRRRSFWVERVTLMEMFEPGVNPLRLAAASAAVWAAFSSGSQTTPARAAASAARCIWAARLYQ